jgi:hypothetical protein
MSIFRNYQTILHTETVGLRVVRILGAALALLVTIVAGVKLGVFPEFLTDPVTSPITATILLGLSLSPGGAYWILGGFVRWAQM